MCSTTLYFAGLFAQTAKMPRVRLVAERLLTAASHKDLAPPPMVPGEDSWTTVPKLADPPPTTAAPPPSTTFPAGHSAVLRTKPPAGRLNVFSTTL